MMCFCSWLSLQPQIWHCSCTLLRSRTMACSWGSHSCGFWYD